MLLDTRADPVVHAASMQAVPLLLEHTLHILATRQQKAQGLHVFVQDSCMRRSPCFLLLYGTLHRERRAHLAGLGSSLYASSTQHERLQIPFESRQPGTRRGIASTRRAHGSRDRTDSPRLLCSAYSFLFKYTCSSRPASMIQGTGVWTMGGGGACAQYISLKKVCESNKADSHAHMDGFYLCYIELKIP